MNFLDSAVCLNLLLCYRLIALLCVIGSAFTNKTVHASGHSARSSGPVRLRSLSIAGSLRIYMYDNYERC